MLWFSVWAVLVAGTLVGAFLLGRRVYRSARALVAELATAAEMLDRLDERVAQATAALETAPVHPVTVGDRPAARARREALAGMREDRAQRRLERHGAAFRRWLAFSR